MKDEEHIHCDARFQEELDLLKINMVCIASLLKQTLKTIFGDDPSNQPVTFIQT